MLFFDFREIIFGKYVTDFDIGFFCEEAQISQGIDLSAPRSFTNRDRPKSKEFWVRITEVDGIIKKRYKPVAMAASHGVRFDRLLAEYESK